MIDVNLQTDLANKKERDKIRDAKDKVGDVVKTVENVIDKGNIGGIEENYKNNRFATRGANAVEDDPKLSKLLNELKAGKLSEDEAKDVIIATIQKMYLANGFSDPPNIKFEKEVSGKTDGARGTETGTIYLDIEKIKASMNDEDNGGTSALIGLIAHESSHSEKYGENSGNLLIEEGFANSKEELARDRFKETDKTFSEDDEGKEKKEALAEIKKDVATERAISDSLTVNSKDEPVENQNATEYGDKKKTLLEKTKDYAVEKGNEFVLHLKETDWLDTINKSLDYPKGLLMGAGESATFGYTNFIEDHISIYDKETYYLGKFSGNYLVGSIMSEGGKAGGITLTLSGVGSLAGVSVFSYSEAVQLYSVVAAGTNSVLIMKTIVRFLICVVLSIFATTPEAVSNGLSPFSLNANGIDPGLGTAAGVS